MLSVLGNTVAGRGEGRVECLVGRRKGARPSRTRPSPIDRLVDGRGPTAQGARALGIADPVAIELAARIRAAQPDGDRRAAELAAEVLAATGWDVDRVEQGEAAWMALVAIESELEARGRAAAQELPSAQWP